MGLGLGPGPGPGLGLGLGLGLGPGLGPGLVFVHLQHVFEHGGVVRVGRARVDVLVVAMTTRDVTRRHPPPPPG